MDQGAFSVTFDEPSQTLAVAGDVEEANAVALRDAIDKHTDAFTKGLVIDLTAVTYLPSAAVGVLATTSTKATQTGQSIELFAAEGSIAQRVLQVCALPYRSS